VVLEGSDDRWNRACHDPVRWATFGLHARHVTSLRLNTEQRRDTT
jgi:hypothetical protein